jgi:hypothetical protein
MEKSIKTKFSAEDQRSFDETYKIMKKAENDAVAVLGKNGLHWKLLLAPYLQCLEEFILSVMMDGEMEDREMLWKAKMKVTLTERD